MCQTSAQLFRLIIQVYHHNNPMNSHYYYPKFIKGNGGTERTHNLPQATHLPNSQAL